MPQKSKWIKYLSNKLLKYVKMYTQHFVNETKNCVLSNMSSYYTETYIPVCLTSIKHMSLRLNLIFLKYTQNICCASALTIN